MVGSIHVKDRFGESNVRAVRPDVERPMKRPKRVGVLSDGERRRELSRIGVRLELEHRESCARTLLRRERMILLAAARMARHEAKQTPAYEGIAEWLREKAKEIPQ